MLIVLDWRKSGKNLLMRNYKNSKDDGRQNNERNNDDRSTTWSYSQ